MEEGKKKCRNCLEIKPLDGFYNRTGSRDGKQGMCIDCHRAYKGVKTIIVKEDLPTGYKRCTICKEVKETEDFPSAGWRNGKKRLHSNCKACRTSAAKERYQLDLSESRRKAREQQRKQNYGLTPEKYRELLERQNYACAICGIGQEDASGSFHVDHDHACCPTRKKSCGKCVRSLLCGNCNVMIGMARDSSETLRSAAEYLEKWNGIFAERQNNYALAN